MFRQTAKLTPRLPRNTVRKSSVHTGRTPSRLGTYIRAIRTLSNSGLQARKLRKQMAMVIPKIKRSRAIEKGGTSSFQRGPTKITKNTQSVQYHTRPTHITTTSSNRDGTKRGGRSNKGSYLARAISQTLYEAKTRRHLEANHRPVPSKRNCRKQLVQDGNTCLNKGSITARRTRHSARSKRRVLPYPHKKGIQEVHEVLSRKHSVPIQSPSIRAEHCTQGIHMHTETNPSIITELSYPSARLSRRLDNEITQQVHGPQNGHGVGETPQNARLANKLSQIMPRSIPATDIHWTRMEHAGCHSQTTSREDQSSQERRTENDSGHFSQDQESTAHNRRPQMDGPLCTTGLHAPQATATPDQTPMVSEIPRLERIDPDHKTSEGTNAMVVQAPKLLPGGSPYTPPHRS